MDGTKECEIFVRKFHPAKLANASEAGLSLVPITVYYLTMKSSWNPMIIFCLLVYPEHSLAEC